MIRKERRDGGEAIGEMRKGRIQKNEKGSRERIEIERKEKETKGSSDDNLKWRRRNITTWLCLLFNFLKALRYSSECRSSRLDSAVKNCSSEVQSPVERLGKESGPRD